MSQKLLRRGIAVVAAAALAFSLAACSTSSDAGSGSTSGASASDAFPVTIKSALGGATIESKPKRVVTIGWGAADTVVSLGTTPVGIEEVTWGGDSEKNYPWVTSAIEKRGDALPKTFAVYPDIDMTALAELNPDVIIAPQSGITAKQYKTLSALAPTVAYPGEAWGTSWSDEMTIIGKVLGESDKAADQIAGIKTTLAKTAAENPDFAKYNFTYIYAAEPGSLSIYQKGDPRVDIIAGLGLTQEKTAAALPKTAGTFVSTIGLEKANLLDKTDIVFTWFNDEANQKQIEKQPLYASIPAVKRGSYVPNVNQQLAMASTVITPLSLPYALDKYVAMIKTAAAKVD
ncbi:iron-siderophore ABC transporter substrate-binding protein [Frondihabitans sp. VKM Ac-2883]|uniref:iron-siderophore ABC transporter substrate-binding protein n=1 Tax=Frondihabitans sp. VKM Ac-2883 TaxID=2783823 RepID=UPI00188C1B32|nr:iron-siderophore ABC transporter substrate-binding protein [Frondihabitans sp. VKM Ac-2883]MBF4575364.1 iron-siderophore ABC transporter substrate-binding protein [Frondihabitans sp. VKM Ac-2883]